jgi:hypothetical protein
MKMEKNGQQKTSYLGVLLGILIIIILISILLPERDTRPWAYRVICGTNLRGLGMAISVYSDKNNGAFPDYENWCDLLVSDANCAERQFVCKGAVQTGDEGLCHYAMNPNCTPDSPNDVVLLFETKSGWNQYGGPEMLTCNHHRGEGCNVLLVNGNVYWTKAEGIKDLNWGQELIKDE